MGKREYDIKETDEKQSGKWENGNMISEKRMKSRAGSSEMIDKAFLRWYNIFRAFTLARFMIFVKELLYERV